MDPNENPDRAGTPEQNAASTLELMMKTDPGLLLGVMHHRVQTLVAVGGNVDAYKLAWVEIAKQTLA